MENKYTMVIKMKEKDLLFFKALRQNYVDLIFRPKLAEHVIREGYRIPIMTSSTYAARIDAIINEDHIVQLLRVKRQNERLWKLTIPGYSFL